MAKTREQLLEELAALDDKALDAEQKRLKARLLEIRVLAAKSAAEHPEDDGPLMAALNLAEEAAQHGDRLLQIHMEKQAG